MRNALLLAVLASVLPMTGCLTLSVFPLYTDKDLVTDLPLEGKWMDPESKDTWEITRHGGDTYTAVDPTKKDSEPVEMRLVRLGERRFLDLTAANVPSLAIEGHMFGKIWMTGDELHIQLMGNAWLEKKARESGLGVLDAPDKDVLLTAPTADLQKLVLRYADDEEAFEKPATLRRVAVTPPAPSPAP
jgi:hypothetical protein